jgi:dUTP pyrophosphatase
MQVTLVPIKLSMKRDKINLPEYATSGSAGLDLRADLAEPFYIQPLMRLLVPTGVFIALPEGLEAQVRPRSGLALNHGITVLNSPGTIDSDYRGEIKVLLINLGEKEFLINPDMKIAQLVVAKYERISWDIVEDLNLTLRDHGGFGSTGE